MDHAGNGDCSVDKSGGRQPHVRTRPPAATRRSGCAAARDAARAEVAERPGSARQILAGELDRYFDVDAHETARLVTIAEAVEIGPKAVLFMSGAPAKHVFLVLDGLLRLQKTLPDGRRLITAFLFAGDFMGLATDDTYAYGAEALAPSRLCRFPRRPFERLLDDCPGLRGRLLHLATGELQRVQDRMMLLGQKTAPERLASFLLQLAARGPQPDGPPGPIALPMGRADIADYLGLTTETVSRLLNEFKARGLIELHGVRGVVLCDLDGLRGAAGEVS